jgi:hypothetical protein
MGILSSIRGVHQRSTCILLIVDKTFLVTYHNCHVQFQTVGSSVRNCAWRVGLSGVGLGNMLGELAYQGTA